MKPFSYTLFSAAAAALLLIGCGGTTDSATGTEITVERGPLLNATVTDAQGQEATMLGFGIYHFETAPVYPVTSTGGVIDMNRNNVIDEGDVIASQLKLQTGEGSAATIVTSLATDEAIKTMLQQAFGLTEAQIYNETPSTDKTIAAISDEVFKYSIENNISDPSQLTLQAMEMLRTQISARIEAYEASEMDAEALEQALVQNELALEVMTQTQAENVETAMMGAGSGDSNASASASSASAGAEGNVTAQYAYTYGGSMDGNASSSAQSSSESPDMNETTDACDSSCSSSSQSGDDEGELTDEQKYTLAYMWNEEKLAKDIYLALNDVWPNQTLYTIATKSETEHEAAVEALIETYDINITDLEEYEEHYSEAELRAFGPGEYGLTEIQALYDTLYAKGVQSAQDALEVGCMVEVTDINDLNEDIATAEGADDLVSTFEHLQNGSYNHYWAFDEALKAMGVSDGCCILGDDFCKTAQEYPKSSGSQSGH